MLSTILTIQYIHTKTPAQGAYFLCFIDIRHKQGFPGDSVVKNPPADAGDMGSIPGPGRSHMPWSS